jgi:predicted TIM-barrel fold metal-dependent hydrolase
MTAMKVTLLGTGSPLPALKRASSSYMVEVGRDVMLIDHGPGAFQRLMQAGKAWVKLTGPYRISAQDLPHADTVPYAHALLKANAAQVIWGTDWPHVMHKGQIPNDGDLTNLLLQWMPDEKQREQVLVANPARLYGF